jgi:hypothetical protein
MALSATDRGTGTHNSSALTFTLSPSGNFAAGSYAELAVAADNAETNGVAHTVFTVTDSLGNTWARKISVLRDPGAASAGVEGGVFCTSQNAGTLTTGTTITVTFGVATTAKAWALREIVPTSGKIPCVVSRGTNTGTSTSPTITTETIDSGNLVTGFLFDQYGTEQTITQDADTTNGSWSAQQTAEVGSTATGMSISSQAKVVSATAPQTFNPTLLTSSDWATAWLEWSEYTADDPILRVKSTVNSSSTTFTFSPCEDFAADSLAVVAVAVDNSHTAGAAHPTYTVTDSLGNTWTRQVTAHYTPAGVVNIGVDGGVFTCTQSVGSLTSSTVITVTLGTAAAAKAVQLIEHPRGAYVAGGAGTGASGTTPTVTTSSITTPNVVYGFAFVECNTTLAVTADADSSNGTWSASQQASSTGGLTDFGQTVAMQWKRTSGTATQTYNPTLGSSNDAILGWLEVTVAAAGGGARRRRLLT